jgi:hypothetical protein
MPQRVTYLYNNLYNQGCCRVCRKICKKKKKPCVVKFKALDSGASIIFSFNGESQKMNSLTTGSQDYLKANQFAISKTKQNSTVRLTIFYKNNIGSVNLYQIDYKNKYNCLNLRTSIITESGSGNSNIYGNIYQNNRLIKKNVQVGMLFGSTLV